MGIVKRIVSKIKTTAGKIGPAIQKDNYGTGTSVGGTTVKTTGTSGTTTGSSGTTSHTPNVVTSASGSSYVSSSEGGSGSSPTQTLEVTKPKVEIKKNVISPQIKQEVHKPNVVVPSKTYAQLVSQRKQDITQLRKEAGTYGKGYDEARERYEINKYLKSTRSEEVKEEPIIDEVKSQSYISLPPTGKETYKKYVKEEGYIKGTLGFLGGEVREFVTQKQFQRASSDRKTIFGGEYELYQPHATGRLTGSVVSEGIYFTPASPFVLFGSGVEELGTKAGRERIKAESLRLQDNKGYELQKEYSPFFSKVIAYGKPATEIGLGLLGFRELAKKPRFEPSGKVEIKTEQQFMTKLKTENIPKIQKIESETAKLLPKIKTGGTTTVYESYNPLTKTTTTAKRYSDVQYSDAFGNVVGETTRTSLLGKYGHEYKLGYQIKPETGITEYKVFKNDKLIQTYREGIPEPSFGLTEKKLSSKIKLEGTQVSPEKVKTRFTEAKTRYSQELVNIGKEKYNVLSGKNKIIVNEFREIKVEPAKKILKVGVKSEKLEVGINKEVQRKTAKFSKQGSYDVLKLNKPVVYEDMIGLSATSYKSPRFQDILKQSIESKGKFVVTKETPFNKVIEFEKGLITNKRGQLILEPQLDVNIKTPEIKLEIPKVETKIYLTKNLPRENIELGRLTKSEGFSLSINKEEQIISSFSRQLPAVISKVKLIELPKTKQIDILKTFSSEQPRLKEKAKLEEVQKEVQILKEVQITKQETRQSQKQRPRQMNMEIEFLKTRTETTPRPKPRIPFDFKGKGTDFVPKIKSLEDDFKVWVTRGGKNIELEKSFKLLPEARGKLREELKMTLRAGGGITKGGKKLKFSEIGLFGDEFAPSKVSQFKVIQRKEKRLGSRSETKEIQYFKGKGGNFL